MKKYRVTWHFADGAIYSYILSDSRDDNIETGDWTHPFPNEEGNSFAYGLWEADFQEYVGAAVALEHGDPIRCNVREE